MNQRNEEILSAYLDGELTSDEQAEMEERLASDESFRQLHNELRALRIDLESLPRYQAPAGFAEQIMARARKERVTAERAAASGGTAVAPSEASKNEPNETDTDVLPNRGTAAMTGRSRWIWPAVAIAAAIMIIIFSPPGEEEVAHNDAPAGGSVAAPAAGDAADQVTEDTVATDDSGQRPPTTMQAAPDDKALVTDPGNAAQSEASKDGQGEISKRAASERAQLAGAASGASPTGEAGKPDSEVAMLKTQDRGNHEPKLPGQAPRGFAANGRPSNFAEQPAGQSSAPSVETNVIGGGNSPAIADDNAADRAMGQIAAAGALKAGLPRSRDSSFRKISLAELSTVGRDTLVVTCTVTSEVARRELIEQLLAAEGAEVGWLAPDAPPMQQQQTRSAKFASPVDDAGPGKGAAGPRSAFGKSVETPTPPANPKKKDRQRASGGFAADASRILLVQATTRQLEQTIYELADHPDKILELQIGDRSRNPRSAEKKDLAKRLDEGERRRLTSGAKDLPAVRRQRLRQAQRELQGYLSRQESAAKQSQNEAGSLAPQRTVKSQSGDAKPAEDAAIAKQAEPLNSAADDTAGAVPGGKNSGGEAPLDAAPDAEFDSLYAGPPLRNYGNQTAESTADDAIDSQRLQVMFVIRVAAPSEIANDLPAADPAALREPAAEK